MYCLTVSNLKLDDVFSDVFGRSSLCITRFIIDHPGQLFAVASFVDGRCKTPIEEIQAAVDGAVSSSQAVNLSAKPVNEDKILTTSQALNLLRLRGYTIRGDACPSFG